MNRKKCCYLSTLIHRVSRYKAYCTSFSTHGGVAPPRNGATIPRRRALLVTEGNPFRDTAMNVHYASFNYSF